MQSRYTARIRYSIIVRDSSSETPAKAHIPAHASVSRAIRQKKLYVVFLADLNIFSPCFGGLTDRSIRTRSRQ